MIEVCIVGAMGQMGRAIVRALESEQDLSVVAGIDLKASEALSFPVYTSLDSMAESPQVVVDFSRADNLQNVLDFCVAKGLPALICATAHSEAQKASLVQAARRIPVFFSYNNSLGVALVQSLIATCARVLGEAFDVEIFEKHHNRKVDAPSGTAQMLFDALNQARGGALVPVYDRQSEHRRRTPNEVGMMSFRGGTLAGEHSVFFAGDDEVIEITHSAANRGVFVAGTLRAIRFLLGKAPGLYDMNDVLALPRVE